MSFFATTPSTVAQVMGDFQKRIDDLNAVATAQDAEASRQAAVIEEARSAMDAATNEASLARATAQRLKEAYQAPEIKTAAQFRSEVATATAAAAAAVI